MLLSCSFFNEAFKIVVLSDCTMGRKWVYRVSTASHSQKGLEPVRTKCPVYPVYEEWKAGTLWVTCQIGTLLSPAIFPEDATVSPVSVNARAPHAERG